MLCDCSTESYGLGAILLIALVDTVFILGIDLHFLCTINPEQIIIRDQNHKNMIYMRRCDCIASVAYSSEHSAARVIANFPMKIRLIMITDNGPLEKRHTNANCKNKYN